MSALYTPVDISLKASRNGNRLCFSGEITGLPMQKGLIEGNYNLRIVRMSPAPMRAFEFSTMAGTLLLARSAGTFQAASLDLNVNSEGQSVFSFWFASIGIEGTEMLAKGEFSLSPFLLAVPVEAKKPAQKAKKPVSDPPEKAEAGSEDDPSVADKIAAFEAGLSGKEG